MDLNKSPDKKTFVTGIRDQSPDMDESKRVLALMNQCVDEIEPQFQRVLENHETDFIAAYKVSLIYD